MSRDNEFAPAQWKAGDVKYSEKGLYVGSHQVMQYWEDALMKELARGAASRGGSVLEVGFGLGISAGHVLAFGCDEYTVVEAHPEVAKRAREWGGRQSTKVNVIEGLWQDVVDGLNTYDGILFDTYPTNATEYSMPQHEFVRPFMDIVPGLLRPGGHFTYYSDETRDFRADHIKLILSRFNTARLTVVDGLQPPTDCDYWKSDHMVVPLLSSPKA